MYAPLTLEHQLSTKLPEGRFMLSSDMQVLALKTQTRDEVPMPYLQPLLPLNYLTHASGSEHADKAKAPSLEL